MWKVGRKPGWVGSILKDKRNELKEGWLSTSNWCPSYSNEREGASALTPLYSMWIMFLGWCHIVALEWELRKSHEWEFTVSLWEET